MAGANTAPPGQQVQQRQQQQFPQALQAERLRLSGAWPMSPALLPGGCGARVPRPLLARICVPASAFAQRNGCRRFVMLLHCAAVACCAYS